METALCAKSRFAPPSPPRARSPLSPPTASRSRAWFWLPTAGESIAAEAAKVAGVSKVALVAGDSLRAGADENAALALAAAAAEADYVVAVSSAYARAVMPRAAALADSQMISEAIAIEAADTFARPIYAGNAVAVVKSADARRFLSVRQTAFAPIEGENDSPAPIESAAAPADSGLSEHIEEVATDLSRPELSAAKIVVSGGRGVGSADNFKMLEKLADKLGAALGASRAAVDAGYVPNDYQVGRPAKSWRPICMWRWAYRARSSISPG